MKSIKFYALHLLLTVALMSFTVKKDTPTYTPPRDETMRLIGEVLTKARTYTGTPYKWGGIKSSGLDCSALVVLSFSSIGNSLFIVNVSLRGAAEHAVKKQRDNRMVHLAIN